MAGFFFTMNFSFAQAGKSKTTKAPPAVAAKEDRGTVASRRP